MKLIVCLQFILVLIHPSTTHTVLSSSSSSSFYQYYPGLVWDDCTEPVSASRSVCTILCEASNVCLGINFLHDIYAPRPCQLCLSSATKSLSRILSPPSPSMYFRFTTQAYQPPDSPGYIVDVPDGLFDGQTIFFGTKLDIDEYAEMLFLDDPHWGIHPLPEVDLMLIIGFGASSRPHTVHLDNFDSAAQAWSGPFVWYPISSFLNPGVDTYTVVFVNQLSYSVYIDGKLVEDYARKQRKQLKDIKHIRLAGTCPYVQMTVR